MIKRTTIQIDGTEVYIPGPDDDGNLIEIEITCDSDSPEAIRFGNGEVAWHCEREDLLAALAELGILPQGKGGHYDRQGGSHE